MKKIIRYIICEGEKSKTEKNFLNGYQKDVAFIKKINSNNKRLINFLNNDNHRIIFEFENIEYKNLETFLDVEPQQSYLIIYVDNDQKVAIDYVKEITQKKKIKDMILQKQEKILVYPSDEKAFEELLSYFYGNPNQIYKKSGDLYNLKKLIGEKFKTDDKIYQKFKNPNLQKNFLNNLKIYKGRRIFNLLYLKL